MAKKNEVEIELKKLRSYRSLISNYVFAFGWEASKITDEDFQMIKVINSAIDSVKDQLIDRTYGYAVDAVNEEYDRYRNGED